MSLTRGFCFTIIYRLIYGVLGPKAPVLDSLSSLVSMTYLLFVRLKLAFFINSTIATDAAFRIDIAIVISIITASSVHCLWSNRRGLGDGDRGSINHLIATVAAAMTKWIV